ncbi:MAG: DUF4231 domain-containing protein [Phycisphaerae bacterium]|jgi:hypothetical protein
MSSAANHPQPAKPELALSDKARSHPAWLRLEDQFGWYHRKSMHCQKRYKWLKLVQIVLAVAIPIFSHLPLVAEWLTSVAGALIAILEGVQHVFQYSTLWMRYRSTAEHLKHEKFLCLSAAGPYRDLSEQERLTLLAERVEEHVSTEHAAWLRETRRVTTERKPETK